MSKQKLIATKLLIELESLKEADLRPHELAAFANTTLDDARELAQLILTGKDE